MRDVVIRAAHENRLTKRRGRSRFRPALS
jgi:hypothetical protein